MAHVALEQDTPVPDQRKSGSCPVCNGRELKGHEACLGCCRSGLDWWLDMMREKRSMTSRCRLDVVYAVVQCRIPAPPYLQ